MIKIVILVSLIVFDLLTKYLIQNNLFLNQSIKINEYFDLVYVQNFGVSFGLFSGYVFYGFYILWFIWVIRFVLNILFCLRYLSDGINSWHISHGIKSIFCASDTETELLI